MKLERLQRASAVALERSRIARNIHDDLGASLTRISLLTQYAKSGDTSSAPGLLDDIHATASEATRAMDEIVWAINPRHDNLESLAVYLANFAQSFLKVARIRCRLVMPEVLPPLPLGSQVRHNLFLCFKEALNNTVRHAQAGSATITMELDGDTLRLEITDDGLGMGASSSGDRSLGGHGLANMLKRMDEIGGGFVSGPAPERGWRTVFSIFLKSKPATTQPLHTG